MHEHKHKHKKTKLFDLLVLTLIFYTAVISSEDSMRRANVPFLLMRFANACACAYVQLACSWLTANW